MRQTAPEIGAEFLDRVVPGWFWRVDTRTLEMQGWGHCVLSQLAGDSSVDAGWAYTTRILEAGHPLVVGGRIETNEARGVFDCPEYTAAVMVFYKRHLCRLESWPAGVEYSMGAGFGSGPYLTMWGPSEFGPVTGNLDGCSTFSTADAAAVSGNVVGGEVSGYHSRWQRLQRSPCQLSSGSGKATPSRHS